MRMTNDAIIGVDCGLMEPEARSLEPSLFSLSSPSIEINSNETAVIRTQVSSCFGLFFEAPKARTGHMLNAVGAVYSSMNKPYGPYKSANEMIRAGFCRLKGSIEKIVPIPEGAHVGIADQDCILEPWERVKIINAIDRGNRAFRLFCLYDFVAGPRVTQCLGIKVSDIDFIQKRVLINPAKEGDAFYADLWDEILQETVEYIEYYDLQKNDFLFCIHYIKGGFDYWTKNNYPLDRRTVTRWLDIYSNKAGINWRYVDRKAILRNRVHTHMAKDTSCSDDYQVCKDPLLVARLHGNRTSACIEKYYIKFRNSYMQSTRRKSLKNFHEDLYPSAKISTHRGMIIRYGDGRNISQVKLINPTGEAAEEGP